MFTIKKFYFLVIPVLATLFFSSCENQAPEEIKNITVVKAQTGTLMDSARISTTALGANSAELAFKSSGRISSLDVQVGQFFKKGAIIGRLSGEESQIAVIGTQAILGSLGAGSSNGSVRESLKQMRVSIGELYKSRLVGADNDVASAKIRFDISKNEAAFAKTNLENIRLISSGSVLSSEKQKEQAEEGLRLAQNQLDNTTQLLKNEEINLYRSSLSALENAFIVARSAREFEDMFLGISDENRTKNDSFEPYFDIYAKGKAESAYRAFDLKYSQTYDWYYTQVANREAVPPEITKEALDRAIPVLESLRESLHATKSVLEKTLTSSSFPQNMVDAYQQKTNEWLTNVELSLANTSGGGVRANRLAIDIFETTRTLKITGLNDAVRLAQKNLEWLESGENIATNASKKDIDALTSELTIKEQSIDLSRKAWQSIESARVTLAQESKSKLAELDAQIAQTNVQIAEARMQGSLAQNQLENQILRAPFDGVVYAKIADVGSVVSGGTPVASFTSDTAIRAIFSVPMTLWEGLTATSDSIIISQENGNTFTGKIIEKNTVRDALSNTVKIEVTLPKGVTQVGERIWLSPVVSGPVGIVVPTSSIITKYAIPSVYVYANGKVTLTQIAVVRTQGDQTLVENLTPDTLVVSGGKDRLLDGENIASEGVKMR